MSARPRYDVDPRPSGLRCARCAFALPRLNRLRPIAWSACASCTCAAAHGLAGSRRFAPTSGISFQRTTGLEGSAHAPPSGVAHSNCPLTDCGYWGVGPLLHRRRPPGGPSALTCSRRRDGGAVRRRATVHHSIICLTVCIFPTGSGESFVARRLPRSLGEASPERGFLCGSLKARVPSPLSVCPPRSRLHSSLEENWCAALSALRGRRALGMIFSAGALKERRRTAVAGTRTAEDKDTQAPLEKRKAERLCSPVAPSASPTTARRWL